MTNDPTIPHPNNTNAKWKSRSGSTDTVTLHEAEAGDYFISAHAFSASRYSLTAYAFFDNSTEQSVALTDGVPETSVIGKDHTRYYTFKLVEGPAQRHSDLTITTTNTIGDPDVSAITHSHT